MKKNSLDFYKKTSLYTDLGLYKEFAVNLPDSIEELCLLQRNQIIHPFDLKDEFERNNKESFYGDMTKVPKTSLFFENDLFPTAQAMLSELLRRDNNYSLDRRIEDKIHVCCREMSILLASILKAKGIPSRVRSGFTAYVSLTESAGDHWITEYYDYNRECWILVDSDMCYDDETKKYYQIDFNLFDIPKEKFIFAAEAYLGIRKGSLKENEIYYASSPIIYGLKAAIRGLFYDFHSLMNDEIIFLHIPKYIAEKDFELSEEEYIELDNLANLMLNPDENLDKLLEIWNSEDKFRIMCGALN